MDKDVACKVCGNHGNHMCGKQWRLANGQFAKRRKRRKHGSVHTVRGGLPGLGKRRR
jgi:hypothetical protein